MNNSIKIKFGKIFWPSLVAALIVSIIGSIIFILIITGIISSVTNIEPQSLVVKENTILHLTLDGEIAEKGSTKFDKTALSLDHKIGLSDLLTAFEKAKSDKNIKGIFLEISDLKCGFTSAREIRNAINNFEKCGKFTIAYNSGEMISQKEYYIASAANTNYAFPYSTMEFMGLGTELMFYKNTLDKLEIEMQVIRGKNNDFKSAVEPFFRENMSDSSRTQVLRYLSSIWQDIRTDISKDRKISITELNSIAENAQIKRANDALKYKLIDGVKYKDEVLDIINKKLGQKITDDIHLLSFEKYAKTKFYQEQTIIKSTEPNIAVILAEGEVSTDGEGLSSKEICKLFRDVRKIKSIKTVVFRINSPGGSALASDEIWREVKLTNKVKKVIVSMGDVAASGGYYIAAPATTIFAEPTTITGS
ncbi:MAG: S49 family peptidase, partial [Flavobacteriia bacterium]|nr:S49 family peptidase [Flavobacteriia bacterium]